MAEANKESCLPKENAASSTGSAGASGRSARSSGISTSSSVVTATDGSADVSSVSTASGSSESATAKSENKKTGKNLYEYIDSFASAVEDNAATAAIDGLTGNINSVDCGDVVYQFMVDNIPLFKESVSLLNKGVDFMNGLSTGVSLSTGLAGSDFVQKICDMLAKMWGQLDAYIEVFVKGAFVIFKRIDAMLERLENMLINLTEAVRKCILDVFRDLSAYLKRAINIGLKIDWASLIELMQDCPCVAKVIAALTGCQEDDEGNNIRNNPAAIVLCIQDKFPFLTPVTLTTAVDKLYTDYIKKFIDMAFGFIESWIVYIYNLLIKPLRSLIKKYAQALTYKIDVSGMISMFGPFECFLVYTEEYSDGDKYYGMSVIDMINTFRQWIPCFQHACPSFTEKVKTRSKEIYKDLRLDDKYWRSAYAIDIYMMCIDAELGERSVRDTELRKMFPESPIDLLLSWFRKSKRDKEKSDAENFDASNGVATVEEVEEYQKEHDGRLPPNAASPLANIISFDGKIDTENDVNSGDAGIDAQTENALLAMMENMHAAGEPYYVEKFYQLIRLTNTYATSPKFIDRARNMLSHMETVDTAYRDTGDYMTLESGRKDIELDENETVASYSPEDDYDEARVSSLSSPSAFSVGTAATVEDRIRIYSGGYTSVVGT